MTQNNCQARVAEAIIAQTGHVKDMSFITARAIDVTGAMEISGCNFFATEPYKREIAARDEIAIAAAIARQMEIDRLSDLGFVLRSELDENVSN